jgi:hypothetical protein
MAQKNPAAVAAKWATNLTNATQSITLGVQSVTVSPGMQAAANSAGYLSGVQANVDKWKANVGNVTLAAWQQAMITKGVPRIATGATEGKNKMQNFMQTFLPYVEQSKAALASTPRGSLESNIQRMTQWTRMMAQFRKGS